MKQERVPVHMADTISILKSDWDDILRALGDRDHYTLFVHNLKIEKEVNDFELDEPSSLNLTLGIRMLDSAYGFYLDANKQLTCVYLDNAGLNTWISAVNDSEGDEVPLVILWENGDAVQDVLDTLSDSDQLLSSLHRIRFVEDLVLHQSNQE